MNETKKTSRELALLLGIFLILAIPFLNKPFHIDAGAFIAPFNNIIDHPLTPYDFSIQLFDGKDLYFFENMPHPPLVSYLIAIVSSLTGNLSETILHFFFMIFPVMAIVSMYFIAKVFTKKPIIPTLLLFSTPVFLIESSQITSDMPSLALFLLSIAAYIYGMKRSNNLLFLSVISANLLIMTRYTGLFLIPVLVVYSLIEKHPFRKTYLVLFSCLFSLLFWSVHNIIVHGLPHIVVIAKGDVLYPAMMPTIDFAYIFNVAIGVITQLSGSTLFFFLIPLLLCKNKFRALGLILSLTVAYFIHDIYLQYELPYQILFILFFGSGFFLFLLVLAYSIGNLKSIENYCHSRLFLLSWFLIFGIFNIFIMIFSCARYNLPMVPPLILLLINIEEKNKIFNKYMKSVIPIIIVAALLIAKADYDLAGSYKDFSKKISGFMPNKDKWHTSFLDLYWYFDLINDNRDIKIINKNKIKKGDLIIDSANMVFFPADMKPLVLIKEDLYFSSIPIKILNKASHAGFYSNGWGYLPFSFSREEIERFRIYQVMNITAEQTFWDSNTDEFSDLKKIGQTFVCKDNNLTAIKIMLQAPDSKKNNSLIFRLKSSPNDQEDIETIYVNLNEIENNTWHLFKFPSLENSDEKTYYFSLEFPDSGLKTMVTAKMSSQDKYTEGSLFLDDKSSSGDLAFIALSL